MPSDPARPAPSAPPVYESVRRGPSFQGERSPSAADPTKGGPKGTRVVARSFYWTMLIALAGAAALAIWINSGEPIEPPERVLAPTPTAVAPAAPAAANPELTSAYGEGALRQVAREAHRLGVAGGQAITCKLKPLPWLRELRTAVGADVSERYPSFDDNPRFGSLLGQFAQEQFDSGQRDGEQDLAQRGQQTVCTELPTLPDYRAVDRLAGDVAARRQ